MHTHLLAALIGVWLMAAPSVLGYDRPAATNDWIVGPLIATFGAVAAWGAMRPLRWANVPLGVWLLIVPFVLDHPMIAALNSNICGAFVIALSAVHGKLPQLYGDGWRGVWRPSTPPAAPRSP